MRDRTRHFKLLAVFLLFLSLFNFPVLAIFNSERLIAGIPALYVYILLAWLGFVILMARILKPKRRPAKK